MPSKTALIPCFIADPFDPPGHERFGGGHLFLFDLGRYLVRHGYSVIFLTRLNSSEKQLRQNLGTRCKVLRLNVGPSSEISPDEVAAHFDGLLQASLAELNTLDVSEIAVVHSHYWIAGLLSRALYNKEVLRKRLHIHSILSLGRLKQELGEPLGQNFSFRDQAELQVFREADHLIAVCPNEQRDLRRLYPEIRRPIRIIPYGVNTSVFHPKPERPSTSIRRAYKRFEEGPASIP